MIVIALLCAAAVFAWLTPAWNPLSGGSAAFIIGDMEEEARARGLDIDLLPVARIRAVLLCVGLLWAYTALKAGDPGAAVMPFVLTLAGWKLSGKYLDIVEKKRREEISRDFPLLVNLVRIYSKASDLFIALDTSRRAMQGELRRQLDIMTRELQVYSLKDALHRMATRCNYGPMNSFVSVLIFGITTGADVDEILSGFARKVYETRINEAKRKVKAQPVFMSILPVILGLLLLIVFVYPLFSDIIQKLQF